MSRNSLTNDVLDHWVVMGYYTEIDTERANRILEKYQIGTVKRMIPLALGISNSNYRVETEKGEWLLKICDDKSMEQLQEEQEILFFLQKKQFPFSLLPEKTTQGSFVYQWEDFYGVIYPFVHGEAPTPNENTCDQMGKALAQLHQYNLTDGEVKQIRPYEKVGQPAGRIRDYTLQQNCPEDFRECFNKLFPDQLKTYFKVVGKPQNLIHGDLYYDNTLFKDEKLVAFIDFEQSGIGDPLLDIGISLSGTCLQNGLIDFNLVDAYMKGYQSVRQLSDEEFELLPTLINLGFFSISLWRIERFLEGSLDPSKAESYKELLEKAKDFSLRYQQKFGTS